MEERAWRYIIIKEKDVGRRIDAYLAKRFPSYSRSKIRTYIDDGRIESVSRKLKPSSLLMENEQIRLYVPGLVPSTPPPPLPEILYEDDRIIVANKPSGMLVHPVGDQFIWALVGLFKLEYPKHKIDLVHRTDRDTSGVLMLTKDKAANAFLKTQLASRNVQKAYQAIVRGVPEWDENDLIAPIDVKPKAGVRLRRAVVEGGQYCHTTFSVLQRLENYSLLECKLHTGRTHQIRVHCEHLGFPLLGDKLYGHSDDVFISYLDNGVTDELRETVRFSRHCLHASRITFPHPDGSFRKVRAPLPPDMAGVMAGKAPVWKV
jgi:23S rRNA pseudouridine1911/1915/1917 synthase